jgi:hypothetical protein
VLRRVALARRLHPEQLLLPAFQDYSHAYK